MFPWTQDEVEHYCDLRGFDNDRKVVIKERFEKF